MTDDVWIVGVGMTAFGVHRTRSVADLTREAVTAALDDAGATQGRVGAAFFGNTAQGALEGQLMVGGQISLRSMGFERIPIFNVENACATGATALNLAVNHVRAGAADVALAVGVEKMNFGDQTRTMGVFSGAYDVSDEAGLRRTLAELGGELNDDGAGDRSIFMDIYATLARAHMAKFGTTQRQLAAVAAKNHRHAVSNVKAHYRVAITAEEVLVARALGYPLTVPMCAPITDGASAAVVCGQAGMTRLRKAGRVRVMATAIGSGVNRPLDSYEQNITHLLAKRAYEEAGVGPEDVSVAEVHDATAFAEILQTEMLGLCSLGEGGGAAESGATTLGGRIPVNPSGGLESKGHPLGATGLAQIYELVSQLRGTAGERQVPGVQIAIAENGGGFYQGEEASAAITILGI